MPISKPKPVPLSTAANAMRLSIETVRRDIRRGCPHSRQGRKMMLDLAAYRQWRRLRGLTGEKGRPVGGGEPSMTADELREATAALEAATGEPIETTVREMMKWLKEF